MANRICTATLAAVGALVMSGPIRSAGPAVAHKETGDIELFGPDKIQWQEGPPSLPKGAMIAVLEGDPSKEGPFVFRSNCPMATACRRTHIRRRSGLP
jgi:hypothetical protein